MVKPSVTQLEELVELRNSVIEVMASMEVWSEELLTKLTEIDLGVFERVQLNVTESLDGAEE